MKDTVHLRYSIEFTNRLLGRFCDDFGQVLDTFATKQKGQLIDVALSNEAMTLHYGRKKEVQLNMNTRTGAKTFLDHRKKEYYVIEQKMDYQDESAKEPAVFFRCCHESKQIRLADKSINCVRHLLEVEGILIELWIGQGFQLPELSARQFWHHFIPAPVENRPQSGLLHELVVRDRKDINTSMLHLTLEDLTTTDDDDPGITIPKDYRAVNTNHTETDIEKFPDRDIVIDDTALLVEQTLQEAYADLNRYRNHFTLEQAVLAGRGDEVAMVVRQEFLDQIKNIVNSVSRCFNKFYGDGEGGDENMHVMFDWWQQLRPHLNFSDTESVIQSIKKLWLAYNVMQGQSLAGLTAAEAGTYYSILTGEAIDDGLINLLGLEASRYLTFISLFSASRVTQFEDDQFDELTKIRKLDFGVSEFEKKKILDLINFKAWDFDTDLVIGNRSVVDKLQFNSGKVELLLKLKQFKVDFQFYTTPCSSARSIIAAILTLGGSALLSTNYGYGYINIDNARIAIDITANQHNGITSLEATVNQNASDMDSSVLLFGVNIVQSVLTVAGSAIASWFDLLNPTIFNELKKPIADGLKSVPLIWPEIWNAQNSPPIESDGVRNALRVFKGKLDPQLTDISGSSTLVDYKKVPKLGYVMSDEYLTGWVREIIGDYASEREMDIHWEAEFDVTLPDLSTFELPEEVAETLNGFDIEVGRFYRTRLVRNPPIVRFEHSGQSDSAGTVEVEFGLALEAVVKIAHTEVVTIPPHDIWRELPELEEPEIPGLERPDLGPPWVRDPGTDPRPFVVSKSSAKWMHHLQNTGEYAHQIGNPMYGMNASMPVGLKTRRYRYTTPDAPLTATTGSRLVWEYRPAQHKSITGYSFHVLATLLKASFKVKTELLLGFNKKGNMWLPEIKLCLKLEDGNPVFVSTDPHLTTQDPFDGVSRENLKACITTHSETDVHGIFNALLCDAGSMPTTVRKLVPEVAVLLSAPQDVLDMVVFKQIGDGDQPDFSCFIQGSLLYWNIEVVENIASNIQS